MCQPRTYAEHEQKLKNIAAARDALQRDQAAFQREQAAFQLDRGKVVAELDASKAFGARLQTELESVRRENASKGQDVVAYTASLKEFEKLSGIVSEFNQQIQELLESAEAYVPKK